MHGRGVEPLRLAAVEPKDEPDEGDHVIPQDFAAFGGDEARDGAAGGNAPPRSAAASDPVEAALAKALTDASTAGRFDVVAQLAKELEARRLARLSNVVTLDQAARRKGDG